MKIAVSMWKRRQTKTRNSRIQRRNREWIREYKQGKRCKRCGESDPVCLEFHHRDPSKKSWSVAAMVSGTFSIERIKKEIAKCDVLCANCHRKHHHGNEE